MRGTFLKLNKHISLVEHFLRSKVLFPFINELRVLILKHNGSHLIMPITYTIIKSTFFSKINIIHTWIVHCHLKIRQKYKVFVFFFFLGNVSTIVLTLVMNYYNKLLKKRENVHTHTHIFVKI